MKRSIILSLLTLPFLINAQTTNGLVGHYKGDNNTDDSSGNGFNATLSNGTTYGNDRFENANQAFSLDGSNDNILLPNNLLGTTISEVSISFWVYHTTTSGVRAYINKQNGSYPFLVRKSSSNIIQFYTYGSLAQVGGDFSGTTISANTWHHIVVTYDGSKMKVYLDNNKSTTEMSQSGNLVIDDVPTYGTPDAQYKLGEGWSGANSWLNGRMEDIRIYNRALTTQEISDLYNEVICDEPETLWQISCNDIFFDHGAVAIGINEVPSSYRFAVNGKAIMEEINVQLEPNWWPDFVFNEEYPLMDLKVVGKFISENKHLPSIPTGSDVKENGINLGEMNAKLLQKIEELTLYLIEQNKQLNKLKDENKELFERMEKLEK